MKKIASLTMTMVLSAMIVMATTPYTIENVGGHSVVKSTGEQAIVLAEFDHEVDIEHMPAEVRSFLDSYAAVEKGEAEYVSFEEEIIDSVDPLLGEIKYDQGTPYNDLCPIINGARAVTGCVATAMAQVMRYWKYPQVGTGSATYTSSSGAATYYFADHPFDWDNMLETYSRFSGYTPDQGAAVANLMLACGASVNMNYDNAGSGSYISNSYKALKDNFGYTPNMKYYESDSPNWDDWAENLKEQFKKGFPVLYAGTATSGGHAFVLDGYRTELLEGGDTKTKFHVNWGWNGQYNGYFLLFRLQPDGDNYSNTNQRVVLDIYPNNYQAIDAIEAESKATKELRNGQVVIIRNNRVYSVQGQRIE